MYGSPGSSSGPEPAPTRIEPSFTDAQWELVRERLNVRPRELQVVRLVLQEKSERAVARELEISKHTVREHLKHAYRRMGIHSRTALARRFDKVCAEVQASAREASRRRRKPPQQ
jgi:DNA-binding CsgD family transcriptional regulator